MSPAAVERGGRGRLRPPHAAAGSHLLGVAKRTPPVCVFWLQGRCTRRPCPFLHLRDPRPPRYCPATAQVQPHPYQQTQHRRKNVWRNPDSVAKAAAAAISSVPSPPGNSNKGGSGTILVDGGTKNKNSSPPSGVRDGCDDAGKDGSDGVGRKIRSPPPPTSTRGDGGIKTSNGDIKTSNGDACGDVGDSSIKNIKILANIGASCHEGPLPPTPPAVPMGVCIDGDTGCNGKDASGLLPLTPPATGSGTDDDAGGDGGVKHSKILANRDGSFQEAPAPLPPTSPSTGVGDAGGDGSSEEGLNVASLEGTSFFFLTALGGHQNTITGIALASGFNNLFSSSSDGTIRIWDAVTWQCIQVVDLGVPIACLVTEHCCVFAGARGAVHGCHVQTGDGITLPVPVGQVHSLATTDDMLFAGLEDGAVLAWKASIVEGRCHFGPATTMLGHTSAVVSLAVGCRRLYSGSTDYTIRAWDLGTLQCAFTVSGHTDTVTAVLCWSDFLLSGSLDGTIRAWGNAAEDGRGGGGLEEVYRHQEEHGVLVLTGTGDPEGRPVLMCSLGDDSVRLYDLPWFSCRGAIRTRGEVRAIHTGAKDGPFFTGDATGDLIVWSWSSSSSSSSSTGAS